MVNPWLNIPASDYEDHMNSPKVDQLSFLANNFKESLEHYDCDTVALLGCATGNGLKHIKSERTSRVTAVDINPEYLKILRERYGNSIPGLEVIQDNLESCTLEDQAYSLIFTGLVFEYLEPLTLLKKIAKWLQFEGVLVTVLQLAAKGSSVTKTSYASLESLKSIMSLIDPVQFKCIAADAGLREIEEKFMILDTGKSFYIGTYKKNISHTSRF